MGSPSSAFVPWTKPKSYGQTMPSGRTFDRLYTFFVASCLSLLRLPRGVSIVTLTLAALDGAACCPAPAACVSSDFQYAPSSREPGHRLPDNRAGGARTGVLSFPPRVLQIGLS